MNAAEAFEHYVEHPHRGTRIAAWVVMACIAVLVILVMR